MSFCPKRHPFQQNEAVLLIGPVFTREAITAPRKLRFYIFRTVFVAALFGLMLTSWQILVGSQQVTSPGDLARFGAAVFQILAPLQVAVALPFSALLTAAAVAQEKDRRTLVLLLMTNLSNTEIVLGKLLASMLTVFVVLAAAFPLFVISAALGGVSYLQIVQVFAVTVVSALVAGSLGSTIALWREKTFQSLALTALAIVLWLVGWEIVAVVAKSPGVSPTLANACGYWAMVMNPWQAVQAAAQPALEMTSAEGIFGSATNSFFMAAVCGTILLNLLAIVMVRRWNPSRQVGSQSAEQREATSIFLPELPDSTEKQPGQDGKISGASVPPANSGSQRDKRVPIDVHSAGGRVRTVWDNPILWREVRTWAYGKKILVVHLTYWIIFAVCAATVVNMTSQSEAAAERSVIPPAAVPLIPLLVVSFILLNALAVTSLTNERDGRALDLLLVTDLSAQEIIFGKIGGVFYNAKEMVLLPLCLCDYLWFVGSISTENVIFLVLGLAAMYAFVATLGLHAGMSYANSRTAIATSIGTLLFLFLGVATCMRIMLAFSASFENQLGPFLGVVCGGGVALYAALGLRNPSRAMGWAFIPAPFLTFFAMTSFLMQDYGTVFLVTTVTYGFATAAMLVPAVSEFDIATGRTVSREE
jgi:ABC-type Na+ efflux pump permease subunit